MIKSQTIVFNVKSIDLQVNDHGHFKDHQFTFTDDAGGTFTFCAFSDVLLAVQQHPVRIAHKPREEALS